jgi:long-subunit acyl-CoA synthetase (AMP-forming)
MQGYCREQADLSRGDDQKGFFNTGDIAKWNENNLLEIIGRADRMVKVGGIRVELDHLEIKLKELDLPIWHVVGRENLIYVLVHIGVCQDEIIQALKEVVDIPIPYIHILEFDKDEIPRTENGKVALKKTLEICDKIFGEA